MEGGESSGRDTREASSRSSHSISWQLPESNGNSLMPPRWHSRRRGGWQYHVLCCVSKRPISGKFLHRYWKWPPPKRLLLRM